MQLRRRLCAVAACCLLTQQATLAAKEAPSKAKKGANVKTAEDTAAARRTFVTGLLSGAAAGITVDLVLFPLDTVKTRLQARAGTRFSIDMVKGLFRGVGPAMAASAPCAAVFFAAYDSLKKELSERTPERFAPFVHSAAAAGADLSQSVIRVPFEVVKQRLQAGVDSTAAKAVSTILKTQGPGGFYTGWGALALRDIPFDIIEFPIYEALKASWARRKGPGGTLAPWEGSLCGSLAGAISAGLTTPLDVVKTRLMTQSPGKYRGVLDCLQTITREEGMPALFSGVWPRVSSIAFGGAIFFGAYETAKALIIAHGDRAAAAAKPPLGKKGKSGKK